MKFFHLITMLLAILGGINWTLLGVLHVDLFVAMFGTTGLTTLIYVLVTVSTLYHLMPKVMEHLHTTS
jgi:uncharacterized membrane protein YuzA (DUF378 family)